MNYSTYRFTLDIHKNKSQVSVPVLFGDTGIQFYISMTDGGKPYFIEDGCRAVFSAKKPDGSVLFNDCIIEDNTRILYQFTTQTTNVEGLMNCEIRLYGTDGNLITTPCFVVVVDPRVVYDTDLPDSESESTTIDSILKTEAARAEAEAERKATYAALAKSVREGEGENSIVQAAPNDSNTATGKGAGAFGANSTADADYAFALGSWAAARKQAAFAANAGDAKEIFSAAFNTGYANADRAFAKGQKTNANGYASETGGIETTVEEAAIAGVADGKGGITGAPYSATHGLECKTGANAKAAYAGGEYCEADHEGAFLHGQGLRSGMPFQAVFGKYNSQTDNAYVVVGNGTGNNARDNCFFVRKDGSVWSDGVNSRFQSISVANLFVNSSFFRDAIVSVGYSVGEEKIPNLYKRTVYCAAHEGDGTVFANKLTARKWDYSAQNWLDATLTYDDIIALKSGGGGGSGTVDSYSKAEIDTMLGSYINDINTLVGGDS